MTFWRLIAACAGWALLAYIGFVTLSPIEQRPHVAGAPFERAAAFGLLGFLLASAYPRHITRVLVTVVCAVIALELVQLFVPGRHAKLPDAMEKIVGGTIGIAVPLLLAKIIQAARNSMSRNS